MHHQRRRVDGVVVVTPGLERIDAEGATELQDALLAEIDGGSRRLLLNLAPVAFIDSAGLAAILAALRHLGDEGDLRVCAPQPDVRCILELARLNRLVPVHDDEVQALAEFERAVL